MNIPRDFIELLLAKIDLVELINTQLPLRKKSGNNYFACCPFHNEKSASFSVSQPKQFYYCFGCGAHGNAIDFLMQHDRLPFPEAVETLARQAGMEMPHTGNSPKKDDSLPLLLDINTKVAHEYYEQMRHSERAINYLKHRGISGTLAQQFHLGYAPPGWNHLTDQFGKTETSKKTLVDAGLIIKKTEGGYYDRFRDRIMFPIYDHRGRIIGFGGRVLDQGEPKYLNSPETPLFQKGHELYGLYQAIKTHRQLDRILVVEGYMDVIALFQHDITYAVATLGTATTSHHLQRLFRYAPEIIFCFDGDEAGRTAAWRALQVIFPLIQDNLQIRFLFLPDGEDPDSLVRKEGKAAFEKRITSALSFSTFFLQSLAKQADMNTMEGRARFATLALNPLKQLPATLLQSLLLDEISKLTRIDRNELSKQVQQPGAAAPSLLIKNSAPTPNLPTKLQTPVRVAAALLVQNPHLAHLITDPLPANDLPGYDFLNQLLEIIHQRPHMNTGMLIEYWRGQKEETLLSKLAHWQHMIPDQGIESEFLGSIRQLLLLSYDQEINQLLAKANQNGLSEAEKRTLSNTIAKKKGLITENP